MILTCTRGSWDWTSLSETGGSNSSGYVHDATLSSCHPPRLQLLLVDNCNINKAVSASGNACFVEYTHADAVYWHLISRYISLPDYWCHKGTTRRHRLFCLHQFTSSLKSDISYLPDIRSSEYYISIPALCLSLSSKIRILCTISFVLPYSLSPSSW